MYGMFRLFEEEQLSGSFALESYQNNLHKSEGENFVKNFSIQRSGLRLIVCKWDFRNPRISKYKKENGTGKDILNLEKQQNFTQVSKIAILKKMDKAKNLCLALNAVNSPKSLTLSNLQLTLIDFVIAMILFCIRARNGVWVK